MLFIDIESGEKITLEQLKKEYNENRQIQPTEYNYSFTDYIRNCMTTHNGTLELVK